MEQLFGDRAGELNELFGQFEPHHPGEEPHYYLSLLGTHRDHAGQAIGTALLRECLAQIDAEGVPPTSSRPTRPTWPAMKRSASVPGPSSARPAAL